MNNKIVFCVKVFFDWLDWSQLWLFDWAWSKLFHGETAEFCLKLRRLLSGMKLIVITLRTSSSSIDWKVFFLIKLTKVHKSNKSTWISNCMKIMLNFTLYYPYISIPTWIMIMFLQNVLQMFNGYEIKALQMTNSWRYSVLQLWIQKYIEIIFCETLFSLKVSTIYCDFIFLSNRITILFRD